MIFGFGQSFIEYTSVTNFKKLEKLANFTPWIARSPHIIAMEVMPDHVHMLIEAPPKYAPAKIVQIFKGISSRRMRQEFLNVIKRYIWKEGTLWAVGYYIGSVSDKVTTEIVKEYIENQKSEEDEQEPEYVQATLFD